MHACLRANINVLAQARPTMTFIAAEMLLEISPDIIINAGCDILMLTHVHGGTAHAHVYARSKFQTYDSTVVESTYVRRLTKDRLKPLWVSVYDGRPPERRRKVPSQ